jgi:hypothetical protein
VIFHVWFWPYLAAVCVFQLAIIALPLRIGTRRWEKLEF